LPPIRPAPISAFLAAIRVDALAGAKLDGHPLNARLDALGGELNRPPEIHPRSRARGAAHPHRQPRARNLRRARVTRLISTGPHRLRHQPRPHQIPSRPTEIYGYDRRADGLRHRRSQHPRTRTRAGALEAPSIFTLDVVENPIATSFSPPCSRLAKPEVLADMQLQLKKTGSNEAFVFVHGFNVTFADAARRTAQMAYEHEFRRAADPVLVALARARCWPICPMAPWCHARAGHLCPDFFLEDVVQRTRRETRPPHRAFHGATAPSPRRSNSMPFAMPRASAPAFDQVPFRPPIIDAGLFAKMMETISPAAEPLTPYASKNDFALKVSNSVDGGAPRAG